MGAMKNPNLVLSPTQLAFVPETACPVHCSSLCFLILVLLSIFALLMILSLYMGHYEQ